MFEHLMATLASFRACTLAILDGITTLSLDTASQMLSWMPAGTTIRKLFESNRNGDKILTD